MSLLTSKTINRFFGDEFNQLFPSFLFPLFQNESLVHNVSYGYEFYLHAHCRAVQNYFHIKGCAPGLVLKQWRLQATPRKLPNICYLVHTFFNIVFRGTQKRQMLPSVTTNVIQPSRDKRERMESLLAILLRNNVFTGE